MVVFNLPLSIPACITPSGRLHAPPRPSCDAAPDHNNNSAFDRETAASVIQSVCLLSVLQEAALTNGTPVETSSPASLSSLVNRLQLDEEPEPDVRDAYYSPETRDLFVTVDDPKKHVCTMETYITYRVSTKVGHRLVTPAPLWDRQSTEIRIQGADFCLVCFCCRRAGSSSTCPSTVCGGATRTLTG